MAATTSATPLASSPTQEPEEQKSEVAVPEEDSDAKIEVKEEGPPAPPPRTTWGNQWAYLLTLVGYAVGFGNIWRFPYQVRENGGAAFLIPYCIMLATVGIPVFFLELSVGQRRRKGVVYAWHEISPGFGGIGICCGWVCFYVGLYYNTLLAYVISYFFDSFKDPLPWTSCDTFSCRRKDNASIATCNAILKSKSSKYYWYDQTLRASTGIFEYQGYSLWLLACHGISWFFVWIILWKGTKLIEKIVWFTALFPYAVLAIFFITNCVYEPKGGWLGAYRLLAPDWSKLVLPITWLKAGSQIFFSLGLAYGSLVIFASYSKVTSDCHKDAVTISIINCCTSVFAALVVFPMIGALGYKNYKGCLNEYKKIFPGLEKKYFSKNYDIYFGWEGKVESWEELEKINATIRYGYGEMSNDAINNFKRKREGEFFRTTNVVPPPPGPIGFKNFKRGCSIGQEATASGGGTGFVFVGFTEAVKHIKGANFFSAMFFFMLFFLGIDSGFGTVEGCVATLQEICHMDRTKAAALSCGVLAGLAFLLFPWGNGIYVLDLVDQYTVNWTLLTIALMECIAVSWVYGLAKISYDVKLMTGQKPNLYILLCWKYFSPLIIIFLLVGSVVQFILETVKKGGITYSTWNPKHKDAIAGERVVGLPIVSLATGFFLLFFAMSWLPIQACLRKTKCSLIKDEPPAEFPEEELRAEQGLNYKTEADLFSESEKKIIGRKSLYNLQEYRDSKRSSTTSLNITTAVPAPAATVPAARAPAATVPAARAPAATAPAAPTTKN